MVVLVISANRHRWGKMYCFVRDHDWPHSVTIKCPPMFPTPLQSTKGVSMSCHRGKESKSQRDSWCLSFRKEVSMAFNFLHWLGCNPLLSWNNKQLNMFQGFLQACIAGHAVLASKSITFVPLNLCTQLQQKVELWVTWPGQGRWEADVQRPETVEWRSSDGEGGNGTKPKDKRL